MADIEKNETIPEPFGIEGGIIPLTDIDTGEEKNFDVRARCTVDGIHYYALLPVGEINDEYIILKAYEENGEVIFETIDDDEEFEKMEDYFNDLLFNEVNYDEN